MKYSVDADQSTKRPDVYKQKKNFKSLMCRTSPKSLFDAIADFSDEQKQAVRDIGFGSMLDLHVYTLPRNLTYYVLDSFNVEKLCIQVDDRRKEIPVSAKDVKTYLGFPKGSIPVRLPHKPENSKLENEFKSQFHVTKPDKKRVSGNQGLITPKHVFNHIKANKFGDAMFKRNFMILLYNTMLESKKHGNLIISILDVLADVDRIKDFDWCQLVFDLGIQHKKTWAAAPEKKYCGPLLFLMARRHLLYLLGRNDPSPTSSIYIPLPQPQIPRSSGIQLGRVAGSIFQQQGNQSKVSQQPNLPQGFTAILTHCFPSEAVRHHAQAINRGTASGFSSSDQSAFQSANQKGSTQSGESVRRRLGGISIHEVHQRPSDETQASSSPPPQVTTAAESTNPVEDTTAGSRKRKADTKGKEKLPEYDV